MIHIMHGQMESISSPGLLSQPIRLFLHHSHLYHYIHHSHQSRHHHYIHHHCKSGSANAINISIKTQTVTHTIPVLSQIDFDVSSR